MAARVLVVEDEGKLRELVRSYLERAGFTVLSTGSGAEAITMAADASPDLVVLDLGLPDVPGETVARELRAAAAVPIVMLTAKSAAAAVMGSDCGWRWRSWAWRRPHRADKCDRGHRGLGPEQ
jgi:DNA-binding response OmpR family regulator